MLMRVCEKRCECGWEDVLLLEDVVEHLDEDGEVLAFIVGG